MDGEMSNSDSTFECICLDIEKAVQKKKEMWKGLTTEKKLADMIWKMRHGEWKGCECGASG